MLKTRRDNRFRLLALDVDGTLLDSDGRLRPRTAAAVARAAEAGIRPVLCTGRRYRRALPVAHELGLKAPLVCNSGALVKDPDGHRTLWRADFDPELLASILAVFATENEPAVSFTDRGPDDRDFLVTAARTGRRFFDEYLELNKPYAEVDPTWTQKTSDGFHFHLFAIGERAAMQAFESRILDRLTGRVQTFVQKSPRYSGTMCEVIRSDASKWSAVQYLARLWGIADDAICAVGDDVNDVPMLRGAGLGVAMGHAPASVLDAADLITADHDTDGLARMIDEVLLDEGALG